MVTDLASAQKAIDTILEQGEGARGQWEHAHFGQFVQILDEYREMVAANPEFDPVRPVMFATVRRCEHDDTVPQISERVTSRCGDLFNVSYEILLQIFERYFAHTEETDEQLGTLADATVGLMLRVLRPLGNLITTLPVGAGSSRHDRGTELRAVLRERLPDAASRGRLGAARGAAPRDRELLRARAGDRLRLGRRRARARSRRR